MNTDKLIRSLDFCQIVSDKFADEIGVKRNHVVYVAGLKALPVSDEDPYTQRIKFFCHLVKDDHVDATKLYIVDPTSIQKVGKLKQKKLTQILSEDFLRKNADVVEPSVANDTDSSD